MTIAIKIENLSKQYRLGLVSTRTLSHDLNRWWTMNIRGKDDPFLKIGEVNDRATKGESEYIWALRDINLEVEQGEVLGIIGKNGAGKSTLLKILSKVTAPTTGTIKARGRIASLLEVGTGFHPEMTGRENIYMNGAIMGMTKAEITRKLDEIIDFASIERYIDTPVKRYSSGMTVRLGFAVAAHLDPEILVVDEVLAVGDSEFQKKAIGKMQDISKGEGRTVLFVSHNMGAIRNLCKNCLVLKKGEIDFNGNANRAINYYINCIDVFDNQLFKEITLKDRENGLLNDIEFVSVGFVGNKNMFATNEPIDINIKLRGNKNVKDFRINTTIATMENVPVGSVSGSSLFSININEIKTIKFSIINHNLAAGEYNISLSVGTGNFITGQTDFDIISQILHFRIDRYSGKSNIGFAQWPKEWGNILFQSELIEIYENVQED